MAEVELPNPEELEERRDKSFSRRIALVTFSSVLAVLGALSTINGFLLVFKLPFLHGH